MAEYSFLDRDLSWLSFNYRVLLEAAREDLPLLERINFLSIYSSNLDEFYRVRVPALAALLKIRKKADTGEPIPVLKEIGQRVGDQLQHFGKIMHDQLLPALAQKDIHFIYGHPFPEAAVPTAREYFLTDILAYLQPIRLDKGKTDFFPANDRIYFAVIIGQDIYALNIPSDGLPRFFATPDKFILFIDDIIRENIGYVFPGQTIDGIYSIKITRDAELDLEDEYEGDIAEKIEKRLAKRDAGLATRFLYEPGIPFPILEILIDRLNLRNASIVEGGRYHNLRDLSSFPLKDDRLSYPKWPPAKTFLPPSQTIFDRIAAGDFLLHTPYESYDAVLQYFNQAAIDPGVEEIYTTMYRIARDSRIAHALISASCNGKKVSVFVELKARFDEANNLRWAREMKAAGVKIIYSIPGLKVHAKVALVKKNVRKRMVYYGLLATGNLNENTARFYTDHILLTGNHDIVRELELLFIFLGRRKDPRNSEKIPFQHLLVAQFNLHTRFLALLDREIANARQGLPASAIIKLNNLEERVLIDRLYEASAAGVKITLLVRSICCCLPKFPGLSDNIELHRIVDRFLEHGRVFIFHNNGKEEYYLGSADWMNRNIYRRIEVCFPLYDKKLCEEIREILRLQILDNQAATTLDAEARIAPLPDTSEEPLRAQEAIYHFIRGRRTSDI